MRDLDWFDEEETETPEQYRLTKAQVSHQKCLDRWADLSEDDRRMTTFHGIEAHLT